MEPPNHHVLMMFHAGSEPYKFVDSQDRPQLCLVAVHQHGGPPVRSDIYPDLKGPLRRRRAHGLDERQRQPRVHFRGGAAGGRGRAAEPSRLIMLHAAAEPCKFVIPKIAKPHPWRMFVNTAAPTPRDIYPDLEGPPAPADGMVLVEGRSLICYVARDEV